MTVSAIPPAGIVRDKSRRQDCILRIRAKDSEALAQLYDETSQVVFSLALRILPDHQAAEEVMLGVYRRVWDSPEAFDAENILESLILETRNQALNQIRKGALSVPNKEEWVRSEDQAATLQKLDPKELQALEFAFFHGLDLAAMAAALGAPIDTIRKRICSGTAKLREARGSSPQESIH
jgi:RNA polymerase sigma-70 factor (ECF subfamily)